MVHDAELSFVRKILENFRLKSVLITKDTNDTSELDMGLRKLLGFERDYQQSFGFLKEKIKPNVIYKYADIFRCTYIFLLLPDTEFHAVMLIGPYTTSRIDKKVLMEFMEKYEIPPQSVGTLEKYFHNIPFFETDTPLFVLLNTFGERIWGGMERVSFETVEQGVIPDKDSAVVHGSTFEKADALLRMQAVEERYERENELLKAVARGLTHKVELLAGDLSMEHYEKRADDPIRNLQNYSIIMNTLLRKAVEDASVHPLYIDRLSSDFGHKIELLTSLESGKRLQREMLHRYCLLVKNHSMKGYSLLVRKVITCVDSDLTADLSLNAMAESLNVNASYLSALFKKETGRTLTEYVNSRRIRYGIFLLHSTTLQIQTIAQYCGIPDVNYFTKMFKKRVGKTPKEYRENFLHGTK
ncbi:MAG: helix-turn-helix domain-containing protein [Lachnospiraceae bacterium]